MHKMDCTALLLLLFTGIATGLELENLFGYQVASSLVYPYQVSLQVYGQHFCGGSLIADDIVLTAAHCLADNRSTQFMPHEYKVVAGTVDLNKLAVPPIDVSYALIHENYIKEYDRYGRLIVLNDIAVLKLKEKFRINQQNIGLVKLPREKESFEERDAIASGFGYNKIVPNFAATKYKEIYHLSADNRMYSVKYKILSRNECDSGEQRVCGYPVEGPKLAGTKSFLNNLGTCQGDSGGPLIVWPSPEELPIIIGIVSYGPMWCDTSRIHHFTEVSSYVKWITNAIQKFTRGDKDVIDIAKTYHDYLNNLQTMQVQVNEQQEFYELYNTIYPKTSVGN